MELLKVENILGNLLKTILLLVACIFLTSCPVPPGVLESDEDKAMAAKLASHAKMGKIEEIKELADEGANFGTRGTGEHTALHIAAEKGRLDIVKVLVENGANLNAKTKEQEKCPMQWALEFAQPEIAMYLLEQGAPVNAVDGLMMSNLTWAVNTKNPEFAKALLEKGADPNLVCHRGETPLFRAVTDSEMGIELMTILIDGGVNIYHKNRFGKTALDSLDLDTFDYSEGFQKNVEFLKNRMK